MEVLCRSLAGECPSPLVSPGEPKVEFGEVKVRSSMNMFWSSSWGCACAFEADGSANFSCCSFNSLKKRNNGVRTVIQLFKTCIYRPRLFAGCTRTQPY